MYVFDIFFCIEITKCNFGRLGGGGGLVAPWLPQPLNLLVDSELIYLHFITTV